MLKLFTVCIAILFFAITAVAQSPLEVLDSATITRVKWRDSIFKIDKSQVPTGLLWEYSLFGFDSTKYNGVNNDDDTLQDDGRIFQLHNILWNSKVNNNSNIEETDTLLGRAFLANYANGSIPLIFIYQKYNRFKPTALSANLVSLGTDSIGLFDVPGRTVSPYDSSEIFAFAPYKQEISTFDSIVFTIPTNLFYVRGYDSVDVDFNDGLGFRRFAKGASIKIYYSTTGSKVIMAKLTTLAGVRIAKAMIQYSRPFFYSKADTTWSVSVPKIFTDEASYLGSSLQQFSPGICTGSLWDKLLCGSNSGALIRVIKSCDGIFDKPIIIVPGFDATGEQTLEKLTQKISANSFLQTLNVYGYDFVLITFSNSGDYIEHNAAVLEKIITDINSVKVGTNPNNIIGFSMGGLVARWCLKDMEDRHVAHDVQNYFSYDSPHEGANTPLGIQYIFKEMVRDMPWLNYLGKMGKTLRSLESPATRQMLVTYASYNEFSFPYLPNLNTLDPLRNHFAEKLAVKGFPANCNVKAIALGRGDNTASTKLSGNGKQFTSSNPLDPGDGIFGFVLNLFISNMDVSAYAVPENNTKATIGIYNYFGLTPIRFFGVSTPFRTIRLRYRRFNYTGAYPYEDAPGGNEVTQSRLVESLQKIPLAMATDYGHDAHNFMSVASALALKNQGYSSSNSWQSNNMFYNVDDQISSKGQVGGNTISSTLSPFAAVLTSTSDCGTSGNPSCPLLLNQWHSGDITVQAANFIIRHILNANPNTNCNTDGFCSLTPTISGNQRFCTSANYQLANYPNNVSINWTSVNGKFSIVAGNGTPSVLIQSISAGTDILRVTITNACGISKTVDKNIFVDHSTPQIGGTYFVGSSEYNLKLYLGNSYDYNDICNLVQITTNMQLPNISSATWSLVTTSDPPVNWYQTGNNATLYLWKVGQTAIFNLSLTNSCGTVSYNFGFRSINCSGGGGGCEQYSVTPNPAEEFFNVEVPNIPPPCESAMNSSIRNQQQRALVISRINLYDQSGNLLKSHQFGNVKFARVDVSKLREGVYVVEIIGNGQKERKKIIIK